MPFQMLRRVRRVRTIWEGTFIFLDLGVGVFVRSQMTTFKVCLATYFTFKRALQLTWMLVNYTSPVWEFICSSRRQGLLNDFPQSSWGQRNFFEADFGRFIGGASISNVSYMPSMRRCLPLHIAYASWQCHYHREPPLSKASLFCTKRKDDRQFFF